MTQKDYVVEGRQFRTPSDYKFALRDAQLMAKLRSQAAGADLEKLKQLKKDLQSEKYRFLTILGEDFLEEIEEQIAQRQKNQATGKKQHSKTSKEAKRTAAKKTGAKRRKVTVSQEEIDQELKRQERKRKLMIAGCFALAVCCLGYFGLYSWYDYKTKESYSALSELKEQPPVSEEQDSTPVHVTLDGEPEPKEVLDEYKNLLNKNKKLIGWLKIDDTNIDYPVMQTTDNEYYLDHNLNQEYDKNGSIFMDKDCDVKKPSTNLILYGHHMKSGRMFGDLDDYEKKEYFEKHRYISFDTIYEKGTWEVMYVFRSRVYSEEEIVFKYYQFIDALSEQEFDSYMQEMAAMSLYDTGVTAQYGDRLLTLSTCDYEEKNGRFVVVAKKVR